MTILTDFSILLTLDLGIDIFKDIVSQQSIISFNLVKKISYYLKKCSFKNLSTKIISFSARNSLYFNLRGWSILNF